MEIDEGFWDKVARNWNIKDEHKVRSIPRARPTDEQIDDDIPEE